MENQCAWHGTAPNAEQYELAMNELRPHWQNWRRNKMAEVIKKATRDGYGNALVDWLQKYDNLIVMDADLAAATKTGVFQKSLSRSIF